MCIIASTPPLAWIYVVHLLCWYGVVLLNLLRMVLIFWNLQSMYIVDAVELGFLDQYELWVIVKCV